MASMVHWLKDNPDEAIKTSRGEQRNNYLIAFLVHQLRSKGGTKMSSNERVISNSSSSRDELHWWSQEKMDVEVGTMKGTTWRASGKLASRPDSITGSTEPHMMEWGVPVLWTQKSNDDGNTFKLKFEGEATDGCVELMGVASASGDGVEEIAVKKEPETDEEKVQKRCDLPKEGASTQVRRFQEFALESKMLASQADGTKYADGLISDNAKHLTKLNKAVKMLEGILTGKPVNDDKIPELVELMDGLATEHAEIAEWASKFGFIVGAKGSKRRKK